MTYVRQDKLELIDAALSMGMKTFADLGGSWGVEGHYSRYTLENGSIERGHIVDLFYPPGVRELERFDSFSFIEGDFAKQETLDRFENVDALYLFDVLLHQYNWREVLKMVSAKTKMLVIYNPNWTGDESVRLPDLGAEEYYRVTPHYEGDPLCDAMLNRPDETTRTGRLGKDDHSPFQWGITADDLISIPAGLGFRLAHKQSSGPWMDYEMFTGEGFVFERES